MSEKTADWTNLFLSSGGEGKIEGYKANKNRQAGNRTGSH